jgi:transcriptional regulator with XRE-family HTH domain
VITFFQQLEIALKHRGASKSALAEHLAIAPSAISRWRDSKPRAETLQQISDWLNVSVKWLMDGVAQKPDDPGFVERSSHLNEHKRADAEKTVLADHADRIALLETELRIMKSALASLLPPSNPPEKGAGR